jgi:hypothetical protein
MYRVTWSQAQTNLSSFSFSFSGYELHRPFVNLSFVARMVDVTQTNALFLIYPRGTDLIAKIMFSVMLFSDHDNQFILG